MHVKGVETGDHSGLSEWAPYYHRVLTKGDKKVRVSSWGGGVARGARGWSDVRKRPAGRECGCLQKLEAAGNGFSRGLQKGLSPMTP